MTTPLPANVDAVLALLEQHDYFADRRLATSVFLALKMGRPLFLEGEAGVGKTEIAKVLARALGRLLVRLQCYEGLDTASAVYEWNYPRQMIEIRLAEAQGKVDREALASNIFTERFLIRRPILQALEPSNGLAPVLLIDELDRTDEPFEAYLLEVLAEYQVTIPELGAIKASEPPIVVITSNRTREIHDAIKRRCLYHWVDFPSAQRELAIVRRKVPGRRRAAVARGRRIHAAAARDGSLQIARASPKRSTGPRRWWRWTGSRSIRKRSPTRWARCSSIRTTSARSRREVATQLVAEARAEAEAVGTP